VNTGSLTADDGEVGLVLDRTSFYAEQGGQIGDRGVIETATGKFAVTTTAKLGDGIVHIGQVENGTLEPGQLGHAEVDLSRDLTRKNHTATHLCHWALREILGDHVKQHGSVVDPNRLRFDFDHNGPMTDEQIAEVERRVNEKVYANLSVMSVELPIADAKQIPGVRAFFGDKYGETVRVVSIGNEGFSVEFCGGTHLTHTGEIGFFKIVSEEGIAKGVRRVTAVTGPAAVAVVQALETNTRSAAALLNAGPDQLADRVAGLQEEIKKLRKQLAKGAAADIKSIRQELLDGAERIGDTAIITGALPEVPVSQIREAADWLRSQAGSAAVCLGAVSEGKPMLIAAMTDDLIEKGLKAGDLIKSVVGAIDGRGGGKPNLAQAGGTRPEGIPDALAAAAKWCKDKLS